MEKIYVKATRTRAHRANVPLCVVENYAEKVAKTRDLEFASVGSGGPLQTDKPETLLLTNNGALVLLRFCHNRRQVQFFDPQRAVNAALVAKLATDLVPDNGNYSIVDCTPQEKVAPHDNALWCAWKIGKICKSVSESDFRPLHFRHVLADEFERRHLNETPIDPRRASPPSLLRHELSTILDGATEAFVDANNIGDLVELITSARCKIAYLCMRGPFDPDSCVALHTACKLTRPEIGTLIIENVRDPGALFGMSRIAARADTVTLDNCATNLSFMLAAIHDNTVRIVNMDPTTAAAAVADPDTTAETVIFDRCERNVVADMSLARAVEQGNIDALFVPEPWIPDLTDTVDRRGMYRSTPRVEVAKQVAVIRPLPPKRKSAFGDL